MPLGCKHHISSGEMTKSLDREVGQCSVILNKATLSYSKLTLVFKLL